MIKELDDLDSQWHESKVVAHGKGGKGLTFTAWLEENQDSQTYVDLKARKKDINRRIKDTANQKHHAPETAAATALEDPMQDDDLSDLESNSEASTLDNNAYNSRDEEELDVDEFVSLHLSSPRPLIMPQIEPLPRRSETPCPAGLQRCP
ncbi:hypothetical protein S40293_11570 [Stachybotrys chartarum IBT 40293]|nr:hypothetical protein S40293_11570 [Stachybotrys chartarum IBT 40293]